MHTPDRKLGLLEKYQVSKHLVKCYGSVNITLDLHHSPRPANDSSTRQFYTEKLYPVLAQLIKDHPLLSVAVKDSDKSFAHFIRLESVNLEKLILFQQVRFWEERDQIIAKESRHEFDLDAELPLWHLLVCTHPDRLDQCSITLTLQHVISDGGSLVIFSKAFLGYLNGPELSPSPTTTITVDSSKPLPVPMNERSPPVPGFLDICQLVYGESIKILPTSLRKYLDPSMMVWRGDYPAPPDVVHNTVVRTMECGGPVWAAIVKKSKENGVSVHAILYATAVIAWSKLYPACSLETFTPTNCRLLCKDTSLDEMGNFVGTFGNLLSAEQMAMDPWTLAKSYHKKLQANKTNSAKQAALLKYLEKFPQDYCLFWQKKREANDMGREGGFELSDLGRAVLPSGSWTAEKVWFCQSAQTFTTGIGLNTITFDGTVHATIGWQAGALDESKADRLGLMWSSELQNCAFLIE
ncbi:alcohol acetyltransferase [Phycomyces nitens]|nr:alcohol acetyltransferase [Phycomyces nitens]